MREITASPKSQFRQARREIGYYLLILRQKYGIMGVYPSKTMGIMATFHHGRYSFPLLQTAGLLTREVGLRKEKLKAYQEHPSDASQKAPKTSNPKVWQRVSQI